MLVLFIYGSYLQGHSPYPSPFFPPSSTTPLPTPKVSNFGLSPFEDDVAVVVFVASPSAQNKRYRRGARVEVMDRGNY